MAEVKSAAMGDYAIVAKSHVNYMTYILIVLGIALVAVITLVVIKRKRTK